MATYRDVMARRTAAVIAAGLTTAAALTACRPDTVRIAYRPRVGDHARYRVVLHSVSTRTIPGSVPDVEHDDVTLVADHTVVATDQHEARVRVRLTGADGTIRTLVVRFDRAGNLAGVDTVEGVPAAVFGNLGALDVFPATGIAPDTALRPGQRWRDRHGDGGRLVELGIERGHRVARLRARAKSPSTSTIPSADGGTIELRGTAVTNIAMTRDVDDGALRESRSTTTATLAMHIAPPPGTFGPAVDGTLQVVNRAAVTRLD